MYDYCIISNDCIEYSVIIYRARTESQSLVSNVTNMVDQRCAQLVNQGSEVCTDVMGQITQRFNQLTNEVTVEVRKQCDNTKQVERRGETSSQSILMAIKQTIANFSY